MIHDQSNENAASKVGELIQSRDGSTAGLRVGVRGGGCSAYVLSSLLMRRIKAIGS